jgi:hypothetical protein
VIIANAITLGLETYDSIDQSIGHELNVAYTNRPSGIEQVISFKK